MNKYLDNIKSCIFKILPLKEESNYGLSEYIDSLAVQMIGLKTLYPTLSESTKYITVLSIITFLNENEFNTKQCKREVFKCLKLIDSIMDESNEL